MSRRKPLTITGVLRRRRRQRDARRRQRRIHASRPLQRHRQLSYTITDNGTTNAAADPKTAAATLDASRSAAVNDPPVVAASAGTTPFTEGNNVDSTPVIIDPADHGHRCRSRHARERSRRDHG